MQTFLDQPEATFYHVTTKERWGYIKINGLKSNNKRIFVSRVGELPILLAIALEQLPEVYETEGIVFLKLPQSKNNFSATEIFPDNQADVELTQPFQNIILREYIPAINIEFMMELNLGKEPDRKELLIDFLTRVVSNLSNYSDHSIFERAANINYNAV